VGEPIQLTEPGSVLSLPAGVLPVILPKSVFVTGGRPNGISPPRHGPVDVFSLHTLVGTVDELALASTTGRTSLLPAEADRPSLLGRWPTVQPGHETAPLSDLHARSLPPVYAEQPDLGHEVRLRLQEKAVRHWEHWVSHWGKVGSHLSAAVGTAPEHLQMNQSGIDSLAAAQENALAEEARRRLAGCGPRAWQSGLRGSGEFFVSIGNGGLYLPVRQRPAEEAARRARRLLALAPLAGEPSLSGSASAPALKIRPAAEASPNGSAKSYYHTQTLQRQGHGAPTQWHEDSGEATASGLREGISAAQTRSGEGGQLRDSLPEAMPPEPLKLSSTSAAHAKGNPIVRSPPRCHGPAPGKPGDGSKLDNFSCGRRALDFDVRRGNGGEEAVTVDGRQQLCSVSASDLAFEALAGEVDVREVRVHNGGSTVLAFEWVHAPRHAPLATPTAAAANRCFALREGKGRLAPGATVSCAVSFASGCPGIFHDRWRLVLSPCPEKDQHAQHTLDLRGVCASASDAHAASRRLEAKVAARVVEGAVREIVMQSIVNAAANEAATGSRAPPAAERGEAETGRVRAAPLAPNDEPRAARLGLWTAWACEAAPGMRGGQSLRVFAALDAMSLGLPGGTWTGDPGSLEVKLMHLPASERSQPMARLYQLLEQACATSADTARAARLEEVAAAEAANLAGAVSIGLLGASAHLSMPARAGAGCTPSEVGAAKKRVGGETCGTEAVSSGRIVRGGVAMAWCWESASWVTAAELAEATAAARARRLAAEAAARAAAELQASMAKMSKRERNEAEAARASKEAKAAEAVAAAAAEEVAAAADHRALNGRDPKWVRQQAYAEARDEAVATAVRESLLRFADAAAELDS
jgi:hypothetical protein